MARGGISTKVLQGEILPEEETYAAKLRAAASGSVSEQDVIEIIEQLKTKAKTGDPKAVQLFFDYVLGQKTKPTSVVVHNHFESTEQGARIVDQARRQA